MKWILSAAFSCGLVFASTLSAKAEVVELDRDAVVRALSGCPIIPLGDYVRSLNGDVISCVTRAVAMTGCTADQPNSARALTCMRVAAGRYRDVGNQNFNTHDLEYLFGNYHPEATPDLPFMGIVRGDTPFDFDPYIRQNALVLIGCSGRPIDGTMLPEEIVCFKEKFGQSGSDLTNDELSALRNAGAHESETRAMDSFRMNGFTEPRPQPNLVAAPKTPRPELPRLSTEPRPVGGAFDFGSPTDEDMRQALELRFQPINASLELMQESCENVAGTQNPFIALGCLTSQFTGMSGEHLGVHVAAISAEKCMAMEENIFLCEVGVRLNANIGNNPIIRTGLAYYTSAAVRPIAFQRLSSGWSVKQLYSECTYSDSSADCTYYE